MVAFGAAALIAKKALGSRSLKSVAKGVFKGKRSKSKKKSALWYAKELQRMKMKSRYNKAKMRAIW